MADINRLFSDDVIKQLTEVARLAQQVDSSINAINKSSEGASGKMKSFAEAQKQVTDVSKEQAKAAEALEKQRAKGLEQMAKAEAKEREMAEAIEKEAKTIEELNKQNKALIAQRNKVDTATEAGKKKIGEINKLIDENTEKIRASSSAHEKQRMNIGNYKSALEGLPGPLGKVGTSMSGLDRIMKMIATTNPFTLILVAVTALIAIISKLWSSTDSGGTKMKALWEGLKAIFDVLIKRVADFVGGLIKIFSGKFREGAEQMAGAFKGMGEQMRNAAKAAHDYEMAMDAINDLHRSFISDEAKLRKEIAELEYLSQDQTKSMKEREDAIKSAMAKEMELVAFKKNEALKVYDAEIEKLAGLSGMEADFIRDLIDLPAETVEAMRETSSEVGKFYDLYEDNIKRVEEAYAETLKAETDYFEQGKRNISKLSGFQNQAAAEREKIAKEAAEKQTLIDDRKLTISTLKHIEAEQVITDAHLKHLELRQQADFEDEKLENERLERLRQARMQQFDERAQAANDLAQTMYGIFQIYQNLEMQAIEKQRAHELELAGDNAEQKEKIEKKYDDKLKQLRTRQAKADKAMALFSAIINMARAITVAMTAGPGIGLILAAITAALAAVQVGVIASQPIPAFAKGTRRAPSGLAWLGEKGSELIVGPDGSMMLTPSTATLMNLGPGGQRIYNARETELIMMAARGADSRELREMVNRIDKGNQDIVKAIKTKPVLHISDGGRRITERNNEYSMNYLSKKLG